ncbi:hypothetical protein AB4144_56090, partial [Rhizobiaceae sp. 2RAB30]
SRNCRRPVMNDTDFKTRGPDFVGDLVRQGGTPVASGMTNDQLKARGPGMWSDLARGGGTVIPVTP